MLFVIEFLQQYAVLNLDQDAQLMLTVDYEVKSFVGIHEMAITEALADQVNNSLFH